MYTYFIISPGVEIDSFVRYPDGKQGSYIKYGDAANLHNGAGIRQAYLTHNPDIGVAAVMDSSVFSNPNLGTRLKNYIISLGIDPVGQSEWFSIAKDSAWGLFGQMQGWDKAVLQPGDLGALQTLIRNELT